MPGPEPRAPDLSVVIPVHDEVANVPLVWCELRDVLATLEADAEVIFVDDASTDGTSDVLRDVVQSDPRVRAIRFRRHAGLTAAFHSGYAAARGRVIVTLDGDLQNDPRDIPALLEALRDADAAVGWRRRRYDPAFKRIASRIANAVRRRVMGDAYRDSACSLRAMSRCCVGALPPYDGMHRFVPVLLAMNGYRVVEVPVTHRPRRHGQRSVATTISLGYPARGDRVLLGSG